MGRGARQTASGSLVSRSLPRLLSSKTVKRPAPCGLTRAAYHPNFISTIPQIGPKAFVIAEDGYDFIPDTTLIRSVETPHQRISRPD